MPFVKIDVIRGRRSPEQLKKMGDVIQQVLIDTFAAPERDRYQIFSQHEPWEVICWDTGLGFERTDDIVSIQISAQGRNRDQKIAMYAALGERLEKECGLKGNDLLVSVTPNAKEDWSFGYGRAQFLTGDL
ncbi:tautomerase enzyme domain-containing protein [Trichoderma breve]|uniref:Tautomerase enzyme domain-containing protein n=1 Tax=Trichoderma breve TaxID=2034170 RepID=A0A9W9B4D8_9HYPO|nr:tautomerase enzyme domain-containing protein [Trichoderma breve]KAJ4855983.1 tautomerase enzyme domain-containing protein [Trichoderma breve]